MSAAQFSRDHCKIAVARILQTIGWHSINSTPLEVLTDILSNHIGEIAKISCEYANEFGQTDPNLDHLGLAFQEVGVNLGELEEYVTYVNFVPPAQPVPKYPISKESHLNFLKPGSREVVTRPIHINEHLPPMYPLLEEDQNGNGDGQTNKNNEDVAEEFKKPADVSSPEFKRLKREEETSFRPTREISSVMMTTSGFLSPAREGKLPESKAPPPPPEPPKPPSPQPPIPELVPVKRKPEKRNREKVPKEALKGSHIGEKPSKKINSMKDVITMKRSQAIAAGSHHNFAPSVGSNEFLRPPAHFIPPFPGDVKLSPLVSSGKTQHMGGSFNKALAAAKAKTERLNTTITPIPAKAEAPKFQVPLPQQVDKLVTEPDRKKINILRKISSKEKPEKSKPNLNAQLIQQTKDLVNKINLSNDITIEPIHPHHHQHQSSISKVESFFDNGSPPGTPPTPRTPELLHSSQSPPFVKEKRKRKEKPPKVKKPRKQQPFHFLEHDAFDINMGRPKTPDANLLYKKNHSLFPNMPNPAFPPFPLANFGPGLIPSPASSIVPFRFPPPIPDFSGFQNILPPKPESIIPKHSPNKPKEHHLLKPDPVEIVPIPPSTPMPSTSSTDLLLEAKKSKEHKKEKKDKAKKKNKKEKIKDKSEKKKLKEAKKEKLKIKKEKKKKPKDELLSVQSDPIPAVPKIVLKVNSPSPRPETPDSLKKLNIKPIVKKDEHSSPERKRESSPGLAQISALVIGPPKTKNHPSASLTPDKPTPPLPSIPISDHPPTTSTGSATGRPPGRPRIHPIKPKPLPKPKKMEQPFIKRDALGNEVWICPACSQQDDGRPMIGCDGCDAWYHWVCVGIQVPPDENENWYCKPCLARKNEDLQDKKKKRKKKDKIY